MFCTNCGHRLPDGGAFCTNCGSARGSSGGAGSRPAANPIATVQAMSASNKKIILIAGGVILLLAIVAFAFNGTGGGANSDIVGTWVKYNFIGYPESLELRRNGEGTFRSNIVGVAEVDFTWEADGGAGIGTIVIRSNHRYITPLQLYSFEVVGSTLIMRDGRMFRGTWTRS